ncbi:uncharacterized protein LOC111354868 [Spodoptera litura]|uniref:Uncharacterized protein LOC111354868 n=1 Tax=Spodoptera litura TaxID=69820 RepID=A0A9J7IV01_SPOLT|nr:uncharacterized protein LOC111354868 [Spodoptera litura]
MKRSRGQVMLDLLENRYSKINTRENYEDQPTVPSREICEELDQTLTMCIGTKEPSDFNETNSFTNERLIEKPDSPLPPSADFLAEEMSFINKVVSLSDPEDMFEETPTVENLYRNLSNMSSDSAKSADGYTVQEVSVIVHNNYKEDEPQILHPRQNPICESSSFKQNNLPDDQIESLTPMPSPLRSFSPIRQQPDDEFDNLINSDYTDTPLSSPASVQRKPQKKKDKGRLRERFRNMWFDEKRKFNLNRGLEYMSRTGKLHQKKKIKSACKCPKKCFDKIEETTRCAIFRNFWEIGDHTRQWDFIAKYVSKLDKKRVVTENSQRNCTLRYSLPVTGNSGSIEKVYVCKVMFLNTLSISYNFVKTALDKFEKGFGVIEKDCRGKHSNHPIKIPRTAIESVCSHVKMFQPVESHYTRKETSKVYLDGSLSFSRMFNYYREWCNKEAIPVNCQVKTLRQYRDIINKNFNLSFHIPKKDKCEFCHAFENLQNPTDEQISKHNGHLSEKERARQLKEMNKQLAKEDKTVVAVTFDLQKTQNLPHGNVSTFYYKRKLHFHNFTPFDMADLQGYCYCWDEQTAKKGANEIASCVFDFIRMKVQQGVKTFIFWSDNCGGQNRNRIIFLMYMYCAWKFNVNITHRFLVVGHTQNEGDSIHSVIERKTRNILIYSPEQWILAFKMATTNAKPYIVREVTQSFVFDFKSCLPFFDNWKKNSMGELVMWSKVCEVNVQAKDLFMLNYKYAFEEEAYKTIQCLRSNTRASIQNVSKKLSRLEVAYKSLLPIDKKKFKDLQDLCKSNVIPERYHSFYNNLKIRTDNTEDDSD